MTTSSTNRKWPNYSKWLVLCQQVVPQCPKNTLHGFRANRTAGTNCNINTISLGNETIQRVDHAKFLGIHIYDGLEWDMHIDHVANKIASGSYALNVTKRILSATNLKLIYFSLIHSHLTYGALVWGSAYQYRLHKLEIIQKKCIRNICNVAYNEHTNLLFKKLNIPKLNDILRTQLGKLMYMCTHGEAPFPLRAMFSTNAEIHSYQTRQRYAPHITARTSSKISRTFLHEGPKYWHELPNSIKTAKSIQSFNKRLKKHLINHYWYDHTSFIFTCQIYVCIFLILWLLYKQRVQNCSKQIYIHEQLLLSLSSCCVKVIDISVLNCVRSHPSQIMRSWCGPQTVSYYYHVIIYVHLCKQFGINILIRIRIVKG